MVRATRQAVRRAFTLTEMLVVVLIITVLLGIILPAIQGVKIRGQELQARNDIMQLSNGIESFKATYNVQYVPSYFWLKQVYDQNPSSNPTFAGVEGQYITYLKQVWPRLPVASGTMQTSLGGLMASGFTTKPLPGGGSSAAGAQNLVELNGNQCLVFFLGGFVNLPAGPQPLTGFGTSGTNPFSVAVGDTKRSGPFFEFQLSRLLSPLLPGSLAPLQRFDQFPAFKDPWGNAYIYHTSINGNDYDTTVGASVTQLTAINALNFNENSPCFPFIETMTPAVRFYNPSGFQIVSAGPNKVMGPGSFDSVNTQVVPFVPGQGFYSGASPSNPNPGMFMGYDDIANFYPKRLGAP